MILPRPYTQKMKVVDFEGSQVIMWVLNDMTHKELAQALRYFTEREDFEYCEAILAEAELRNITLNAKKGV